MAVSIYVRPQAPNARTAIVDNNTGIATYDHALFLQQVYGLTGYIGNLSSQVSNLTIVVSQLAGEVNLTQIGAGLAGSGQYLPDGSAHFISTAVSIHNATQKIDDHLYDVTNDVGLLKLGVPIVNITGSASLSVATLTALCDATSGDISITLPHAASCYIATRSREIAISKIDTSSNTVTIAGVSGATIAGETNQVLEYQNEVINLVTDGNNWYLGA